MEVCSPKMNHDRRSFWKSTLLAVTFGLFAIIIGNFAAQFVVLPAGSGIWQPVFIFIGWSVALLATLTAVGGLIVLSRDADQTAGRPDLFVRLNRHRSEPALTAKKPRYVGRFIWSKLRGKWLPRVGDVVEIRSLTEISRTLDSSGSLDALPFQTEMAKFCGQRARVFRCVDKIYDYGRTKTLKRLRDSVLLVSLRCDGRAHDGCQAGCYLIWKTAWLKPIDPAHVEERAERSLPEGHSDVRNRTDWSSVADDFPNAIKAPDGNTAGYKCQFTELAAASTPMKSWDFRQDLRPLFSGNITLAAFCVAMLTRLFNRIQGMRGGSGFPPMTLSPGNHIPSADFCLGTGDVIRVLSASEISKTLNQKGRNRGLWFDQDMLKHCGQRYTVLKRVDRIIDDATGQMISMKTPCIVLDGVECSGEFLRFCAQQDYPYWREAWLAREKSVEQLTAPLEKVLSPRNKKSHQ